MIKRNLFAVFCLVVFQTALGCRFLRENTGNMTNPHGARPQTKRKLTSISPYCAKTGDAPLTASRQGVCNTYLGMQTAFAAAISGTNFQKSNIFGAAVRLSWHDAAEYDQRATDSYGADGCLSASEDHAGLTEATSLVNTVIEPIWQQYCDQISRADFWVLFSKMCAEAADPSNLLNIPFQWGRKDNAVCADNHRMPSAQGGLDEITRVYVTQMGLTLQDALALSGAHSLGHAHIEHSGYGFPVGYINCADCNELTYNAWDNAPHILDSIYYEVMFDQPWENDPASVPGKSQWRTGGPSIALMTDMALFTSPDTVSNGGMGTTLQVCENNKSPPDPRSTGIYGCRNPEDLTRPPTADRAEEYMYSANGNALFLADFGVSMAKMSCVGYGVPASVDGATSTGRLGTLTHINLGTCTAAGGTIIPSVLPSVTPSAALTATPSEIPSLVPLTAPSVAPSVMPSEVPSVAPSEIPSVTPTTLPSEAPSTVPSLAPSELPTTEPSVLSPTIAPSTAPSTIPSASPTNNPTTSTSLTLLPSFVPSVLIEDNTDILPTVDAPTSYPTLVPTVATTGEAVNSMTNSAYRNMKSNLELSFVVCIVAIFILLLL